VNASEKHWRSFEAMLSAFLEAAWTAGGLSWSHKRGQEVKAMVDHLRTAMDEDLEDRITVHATCAPHFHPDGSSQ